MIQARKSAIQVQTSEKLITGLNYLATKLQMSLLQNSNSQTCTYFPIYDIIIKYNNASERQNHFPKNNKNMKEIKYECVTLLRELLARP